MRWLAATTLCLCASACGDDATSRPDVDAAADIVPADTTTATAETTDDALEVADDALDDDGDAAPDATDDGVDDDTIVPEVHDADAAGSCGDGAPDPGEACDDGDDDDLDGCDRDCRVTRVVRRPAPGEVVVSELMVDPAFAGDRHGEWLELVSVASDEINLSGCELRDDGTDRVALTPEGGLALLPSDLIVLGVDGDDDTNGGVSVDLVYLTMLLDDVADEVVLACDGVEIDRVAWTPFAWPIVAGRALALDPSRLASPARAEPASWCLAERPYGEGDRGTPGLPNPSCPQLDDAVDDCRLLPATVTTITGFAGAATEVRLEVLEAGVPDATQGVDPSPSLLVEVGWGPADAPPTGLAWTWTRATADATIAAATGADGYRGTIVAPEIGTFAALGRASRNGGEDWRLCGRGGAAPAIAAALVVLPSPCGPESCVAPDQATCADDGVTVAGLEPIGTCTPIDASAFSCTYEPRTTDCGALDRVCTDGACQGTPRRPARGEVLVSELMLEPTAGPSGQWVELESQVDEPLMLTGCALEASADEVVQPFSLGAPTVLGRRGRVVIGASRDLADNGGALVDRAWGEAVLLVPDGGRVALICEGAAIDEVAWEAPAWSIVEGSSLALSPFRKDLDDNDLAGSWCRGQASYGQGDRGSPGAPNPNCPGDVVPVEACSLLGPTSLAPPAGTRAGVPVRVIARSVTNKTRKTDVNERLVVELGFGARGAAPQTIVEWTRARPDLAWTVPPNQGVDPDEDRYLGEPRVPAPGAWDLWARATADGGNTWVVCDRAGIVGPGAAGAPIVVDPVASACEPDPCIAAPAPVCDGDVVVRHALPATCSLDEEAAVCAFVEDPAPSCATLGAICEDGACARFPRTPGVGEVVVSELMIVPASGALGEWIELYNPTDEPMDLTGCALRSGPAESWALPSPPMPLLWVIAPGSTMVLARSLSPSVNGGVDARAAWSGVALANDADWIQLACGEVVVDTVAWDRGDGWSVPTHRALQLSGARLDTQANDFAASFCAPAVATPGVVNLACPSGDDLVEACAVIMPATAEVLALDTLEGALDLHDAGVTDVRPEPDPAYGTIVELGFGPLDEPPIGSFDWTWAEASADPDHVDPVVDRWRATLVPAQPGDFVVAARVSLDGGATWTLCDRGGLGDGFAPDVALTVTASPCAPNPCTSAATPTCSGGTLTADAHPGACAVVDDQAVCSWSSITFGCGPYGGCNTAGTCNAAPATPSLPGQLVITEVMRDSTLPAPDMGEWIELTNVSAAPLDLRGCELTDGLGESVAITSPLPQVVPAGGWAVFAQATHRDDNGGVQPTSGPVRSLAGMALGNVADTVIVRCAGVEIDRVTWGLAWPGSTGVAMQLSRPKSNATDNDLPANWCAATVPYALSGNKGSPGLDNLSCP
ncbi:MAG: lamin tail domain-containing protein [Deltaproteobacteria bacterium]|nr:lamin tail domain-containing protein [Deltaproteobacteria bacterium]